MKATLLLALICMLIGLAGCTAGSKFLDPRTELDRKIFYIERDQSGDNCAISNKSKVLDNNRTVTRVPMPAVVDINSTIQITIAKDNLENDKVRSEFSRKSGELVERKQAVTKALSALSDVVVARTKTLLIYEKNKNIDEFTEARDNSDNREKQFRAEIVKLWPTSNTKGYEALSKAYLADRQRFQTLQKFLSDEIGAIEAETRLLELQLKSRPQASLALEAFLTSPGKQPTAIHLDGYDNIMAENLVRRDPLGLDLSPEERARLVEQVKATREMAEALERLRRGEQTLNDTFREVSVQMAPEIGKLISDAEDLAPMLAKQELEKRGAETKKRFFAFLVTIEAGGSKAYVENNKTALQKKLDDLIAPLSPEAGELLWAWVADGTQLKSQWEQNTERPLTPEEMLGLIDNTVALANKFKAFRATLQKALESTEQEIASVLKEWLTGLREEKRKDVLMSKEAGDLKADLASYAKDLRKLNTFATNAYAILGRLKPTLEELPASTTTSFEMPLDKIKDTFTNLEQTPRLVGDIITIRATYKSGDQIDTSLATFRVERLGHYADLSPAVVLAKPEHIGGTDTGFRFAPALSWMYHWAPRPETPGIRAGMVRSLEPSIGIHSTFLNFNSPTSNSSAQIGLGATFALWKNRIQVGYGLNLMAKSRDEGRTYFFVGSDLIGLLQTIGIGK